MRTSWKTMAASLLLVIVFVAAEARACPTCADNLPSEASSLADRGAGLPDNPSGATSPQLAEGFYYSILFMLAIPYTLLAAGGVVIYLKLKKRGEADSDANGVLDGSQRAA